MSTNLMGAFVAIGERLREERKKLKKTQAVFAEMGGIGVSALKMYEGNEREPGGLFLAAIANAGADVQYIVTGNPSSTALTPDEQVLLDGYRALDVPTRRRMLAFMLGGGEQVHSSSVADKYRGARMGGVTEGDFTGTANIQVGGKAKK